MKTINRVGRDEALIIFEQLLAQNINYFKHWINEIEIMVENGKCRITDIQGLTYDRVTEKEICLKLVHHIFMISRYVNTIQATFKYTNVIDKEPIFLDDYKRVLRLRIGWDSVRVCKKQFFGISGHDIVEELTIINQIPCVIKEYIDALILKNGNNNLERVSVFAVNILGNLSVEEAMLQFIIDNSDLF